jgi:hypothetical protein
MYRGHGYGYNLMFTLRENHEEEKFLGLGNDPPAFLRKYQRNNSRWSYL